MRRLLAGLLASALLACKGNTITPPSPPSPPSQPVPSLEEQAAAGTYQLASVRGSALPVALFGECQLNEPQPCSACRGSATSGTMTLTARTAATSPNSFNLGLVTSGPCIDPQGVSPTTISTVMSNSGGTWTISGSTITFTPGTNTNNLTTATLAGSTLSMSFNWGNTTPGGQPAVVTATFTK